MNYHSKKRLKFFCIVFLSFCILFVNSVFALECPVETCGECEPEYVECEEISEEEHGGCDKLNIREVIYEENVKPGDYLSLNIHVKACYDHGFKTVISSEDVDMFQVFSDLHVAVDVPKDIKPGEYDFKVTVYHNNREDSVDRTFKVSGKKRIVASQKIVAANVLSDQEVKEENSLKVQTGTGAQESEGGPVFYMQGAKGIAVGLFFLLAILLIFVFILRLKIK